MRFIGDPLTRIAEDHLRILRFFRFHARFGQGEPDAVALDACTARANDLMALSRERVADELLKLLGLADPSATVALMIARGILRPVLPEIGESGLGRMRRLIDLEPLAGLAPDPVRRLTALIDAAPEVGAGIAARLRLSNKQRKRIETALGPAAGSPFHMAYWLGSEGAIDRIALSDAADQRTVLRDLQDWPVPRLPITGGQLIKRGVPQGPRVAKTLQAIERAWVEADFPDGDAFQQIVAAAMAAN